jgi:hypothetical protein
MSLIRATIRMCAVTALKNKTWADTRVYDSDNTPLLDAIGNQTKPYITVFTDMDVAQEIYGRDLYTADHRMSLVLEFGIASAAEVANKGTVLKIPQTDQAMEALVDILERQIIAAIISDPTNPFADLLRQMINKIFRAPSARGGSEDQGTRWAARQLTLVCDTISDPAPGVVLEDDHPIKQFIALARSTPYLALGMKEAADLLEKVLTEDATLDWQQGQAWLGLTNKAAFYTGMAPMPEGDINPTTLGDEDEGTGFNVEDGDDLVIPGRPSDEDHY